MSSGLPKGPLPTAALPTTARVDPWPAGPTPLPTVAALLAAGLAAPAAADVITGTDGPDELVGTARADTIRGYAGNDVLEGRRGGDRLYGGRDADRLYPGRDSRRDLTGIGIRVWCGPGEDRVVNAEAFFDLHGCEHVD